MRVVSVIGGRPNLIKSEPLNAAFISMGIEHSIIDLGVHNQPYGPASYADLGLPAPIFVLDTSPYENDYIEKTKYLIDGLTSYFQRTSPDIIIVYGDLDPGVAAVVAALRANVASIHVEAGLRNYDAHDTEEFNRTVIDRFSQRLFATSEIARNNLLNEGISGEKIYVAGNAIISALKRHLPSADMSILERVGCQTSSYGLVTIHREENLASAERMNEIFLAMKQIEKVHTLVFIQYYSTLHAFLKFNLQPQLTDLENTKVIHTLRYHEYLGLLQGSKFVITDSSGIQDETTYLGIPCFTCREKTHRVETIWHGTNQVVGLNNQGIVEAVTKALEVHAPPSHKYPSEWDIDLGQFIAKTLLG
jgi:UDP-N-acetylglucosamine 2-epimerase (non-hydrolysing)